MKLRLICYYWIPTEYSKIMDIHLNCLRYYQDIFDEAIFVLAVNDLTRNEKLEETKEIISSIGFKNLQFKIIPDDPTIREAGVFKDEVMDKLDEYDGLTFFIHTKGNSLHDSSMFEFRYISNWVAQLYFFCLNDMDDVKKCLIDEDFYLTYGGMLMDVPNTASNKYHWYYPGNFYWLNGKRLDKYVKDNNIEMPDLLSWSTIQESQYNLKRFYGEDVFGSIFTSDRAASSLGKYYEYCDNYRDCDHIRAKTTIEKYDEYKRFYKNIALNGVDVNKNMICVYAICKNESKNIDEWAKSVLEADSVVVLDTGSTDDSIEKLKKYGFRVEQKLFSPWRFDTPKNEAMELAPDYCNILVNVNMDEFFDPGWADLVRKNWKDGEHNLVSYMKYDVFPGANTVYSDIHARGFKWKYPIHEILYNDNEEPKYLNLTNRIILRHKPDNEKSRNTYFSLIKTRIEENPDDYMGRLYYFNGCIENGYYDDLFKMAHELLTKFSDKIDNFYKWHIHYHLARVYRNLKDYQNMEKEFFEAMKEDKENIMAYLDYADYLDSDKQDLQSSIDILKLGLKNACDNNIWSYNHSKYNTLYDILSFKLFYNGNKKESLALAYKAYSLNKNDDRLKNNLDLIVNNMTNEDFL